MVTVGVLTITIIVPGSDSLKDKRHVVRSVVDNLRNKFNLSVAEVGELDSWQKAIISMACVSNDKVVVNRMLDKALRYVESYPELEVVDTEMELV
jgi:uncharacterized protein YlxP (DUF503 family)